MLLGAALASLGSRTHFALMLAGALTALVSGFGLMALATGRTAESYTGGVMALKIVLTLLLTALAFYAWSRHSAALDNDPEYRVNYKSGTATAVVGRWVVYLIAVLTVLALIFSVIWR